MAISAQLGVSGLLPRYSFHVPLKFRTDCQCHAQQRCGISLAMVDHDVDVWTPTLRLGIFFINGQPF